MFQTIDLLYETEITVAQFRSCISEILRSPQQRNHKGDRPKNTPMVVVIKFVVLVFDTTRQ